MSTEALLLVGRDTDGARSVLETHAARLRGRGPVDGVHAVTHGAEPRDWLRETSRAVDADRIYAVPVAMAHTRATAESVPASLARLDGDVHYGEPPGRDPAVTRALIDRASARLPPSSEASLVLVGLGNGSAPYHRQTVDYHATRLRARSDYGEVLTCYLLQNPAVECVRYNVSTDAAVAVPAFLLPGPATAEHVPSALELDRGGVEYAKPPCEHPRVTDAIESEVRRLRVLGDGPGAPDAAGEATGDGRPPLATDGEGPVG